MSTEYADPVHRDMQSTWDATAPHWTAWEPYLAAFTAPVNQQLLAAACIGTGQRVLDVGSGTGDTAMALAQAVGATGRVTCCELASDMLATARNRARVLGHDQVDFVVCPIEQFDGPPDGYDAVIARFSVMFLPDVARGLARLHALLKPGGRIAVAVWTPPEENIAFALPRAALAEVVAGSAPDPTAPGPFRLSGAGELSDALQGAGFADVAVERVRLYQFARHPDDYVRMIMEMSTFFRRQFEALTAADQAKVQAAMRRQVAPYHRDGVVRVPAVAQVVGARRAG